MRAASLLALPVLVVLGLTLAGCGDTVARLVNPKTGLTAECKGFNPGQTTPSRDTAVCVRYYESLGFKLVPNPPAKQAAH